MQYMNGGGINDLERYVEILEKNTFEFDWFGFLVKIRKRFYLGMSPFNVEINENNMACFLEENEKQLMILSREFENSMMVKHS